MKKAMNKLYSAGTGIFSWMRLDQEASLVLEVCGERKRKYKV